MASTLIERLMGEPFAAHSLKISVHEFFAGNSEVIAGRLTKAQIKTYYAMDTDTQTEYDTLTAKAPGTATGQATYLNMIHSVFILAEHRVPGYDTPAAVRLKLGI